MAAAGDTSSYDAVGAIEHEISEEMGRIGGLGATGAGSGIWGPMDLFRYSMAGAPPDETGGNPNDTASFFSIDGQRLLTNAQFNNPWTQDPQDPR